MKCHRDVVVFWPPRTIRIPTVAEVIGVHHGEAAIDRLLIIRQPGAFKTKLNHNGKVVPVTVRHLRIGNLIEPRMQVHHLALGEQLGEFVLQQRQPEAVRCHLDQALIVRFGFAPVACALRIGPLLDGRDVFVAKRRGVARRHQWKQPPQYARQPLHLRHIGGVVRAGIAQRKARTPRRKLLIHCTQHRIEFRHHVLTGRQRI